LTAGELRALLGRSFAHAGSLVSLSGLRARARCKPGALEVTLTRPDGAPIADHETLAITTTDFLATGGDGVFAGAKAKIEIGVPMRDVMADELRARGGTLDPNDARLFDPQHPRIDLPGPVPVKCEP
jgi:hypothetical protein